MSQSTLCPMTLPATSQILSEAIRLERERCADLVYTFDFRNYEQTDQGFQLFRQDLGDALLGKHRTPIVNVGVSK